MLHVYNGRFVNPYKYKYNGKELQDELGLNMYDYGARNYDAALGRWMNIDPLAEKYVQITPYNYCSNMPTISIDENGKEGIVVSGQPGDHKNKEHFLVNGLDRVKKLQKQFNKDGNNEKATWLVYNSGGEGGYDSETIAKYQAKADKAGITMKVVSDSEEIVDYVNDKNGGDSRSNDLVSNFSYIGHATPGDLDLGFENHGLLNMLTNDKIEPSDFKSSAFRSGANINLVGGCRTAIDGNLIGEKSALEQFADKVDNKSTLQGSNVRVYYPGGVVSDKNLVSKNNGSIITINGKKKAKK